MRAVLAWACVACAVGKASNFNRPIDLDKLEKEYADEESDAWHEDSDEWSDRKMMEGNNRNLKAQVDAKIAEQFGTKGSAEPAATTTSKKAKAAPKISVHTWYAHLTPETADTDEGANKLATAWRGTLDRAGGLELASVMVHDIAPTVLRIWFMNEDADDQGRDWVLRQAGVEVLYATDAEGRPGYHYPETDAGRARKKADDDDGGERNRLYEANVYPNNPLDNIKASRKAGRAAGPPKKKRRRKKKKGPADL